MLLSALLKEYVSPASATSGLAGYSLEGQRKQELAETKRAAKPGGLLRARRVRNQRKGGGPNALAPAFKPLAATESLHSGGVSKSLPELFCKCCARLRALPEPLRSMLKGDSAGHEFHGNQWTSASVGMDSKDVWFHGSAEGGSGFSEGETHIHPGQDKSVWLTRSKESAINYSRTSAEAKGGKPVVMIVRGKGLQFHNKFSSAGNVKASVPIAGKWYPNEGKLAPIKKGALLKSVDAAAHAAATSPINLTPLPTEAQISAGNYKKGRIKVGRFTISVENPKGSQRRAAWPPLTAHYGYFLGTEGADGEHTDVFVRGGTPADYAGPAFVVAQYDGPEFDEYKVMFGWENEAEAVAAYKSNYSPDWDGMRSVEKMSQGELAEWLKGPASRVAPGDPHLAMADYILSALTKEQEKLDAAGSKLRVKKGDSAGHEFHGNQYTGGYGGGAKPVGEKPTAASLEAQAKGTRAAVHELLSSGHAFTFAELQHVTGAQTKALQNVLSTLKNPKWAGPDGHLSIQKDGKFFFVHSDNLKGGGKPAELGKPEYVAHPKVAAAQPEAYPKKFKQAQEELGNKQAQEIKDAMENHALTSVKVGLQLQNGVPTDGKMEKPAADKIYNEKLHNLTFGLASAANNEDYSLSDKYQALQGWKEGKASAMAQWAANTTGKEITAKPQEIYQADKNLLANLQAGMGEKEAYGKWKGDTAAEKAGTLGKTPGDLSEAEAKEESAKITAAGPAPALGEYKADHKELIPAGFVPIAGNNFEGGLKSDFSKGMAAAGKAFDSAKGDSVTNKMGVQEALTHRLQSSEAFQAAKNGSSSMYALNSGGPSALEARLVSSWASSSGDNNPLSVALQLATRDQFGMHPGDVEMKRMSNALKEGESAVYQNAADQLGIKDVGNFKVALRDFIQAQYDNTQSRLAANGVKEVYIARGMKIGSGSTPAVLTQVKLQPASSFSHELSTAKGFAAGHSVFVMKVPASQILGSYKTGFGCTNEAEIVVLGAKGSVAVMVGAGAATSKESLSLHVAEQAKNWSENKAAGTK